VLSRDRPGSDVGLVRGQPLVELTGVCAAYGRVEVLHSIDLTVPTGGVVGLVGSNGAGKSTLLRVIAGAITPTAGHAHLGGYHVNGMGAARAARMGVAFVPEGRAVFPNLTVAENLRVFSNIGTSEQHMEAVAYERFPVLADRRGQLAGTLSGGEQQMLAMARALAADPVLLLLDEMSMGLAPKVVDELYAIVRTLVADGVTVVAAEQFVRMILDLADSVVVMQCGRTIMSGSRADLETLLAQAYLSGQLEDEPPSTRRRRRP
jgi:branched-chain amino acid transport system ATP-binding protein